MDRPELSIVACPANVPGGLAAVTLAATRDASRRTVASRLTWIAVALGFPDVASVPWHSLTPLTTSWIATRAADELAPDTARAILSTLRAVLEHGWRIGVWTYDQHKRLATLPPVRGTRRPRGRTLSPLDVETLLRAAGNDSSGARDGAAIGLLVGSGLRRAEVVSLDLASLAGSAVRVIGKGDRERLVPLPRWSQILVSRWLETRGEWSGALVCPVRKDGTLERRRMTGTALYLAMARLTDATDVAMWSPHDGRRTFATCMLDATGDLDLVAKLMGHASTDTTRIYDLRDDSARAMAVSKLDRWVQVKP